MKCISRGGLVCLLSILAGPLLAQPLPTYVLVGKLRTTPFYADIEAGCRKAAEARSGQCAFIGPGRYNEAEQAALVAAQASRSDIKVLGVGVMGTGLPALQDAMRTVRAAGIPIVTVDSEMPEGQRSARSAYIGSDNRAIGRMLAQLVLAEPLDGPVCLHSGVATAANLIERLNGFRAAMQGSGWTEMSGCPVHIPDNTAATALEQLGDILATLPKRGVVVEIGPFAQWAGKPYRTLVEPYRTRLADHSLRIISTDALPMQRALLQDGLSSGQVGERPFEMGELAVEALQDLRDGKSVPDNIITGLEIVTRPAPVN